MHVYQREKKRQVGISGGFRWLIICCYNKVPKNRVERNEDIFSEY